MRLALRELFSTMIPEITVKATNVSAKRRKIGSMSYEPSGPNDNDHWPLQGSRMAELVSCCVGSSLKEEENWLLTKIALEAIHADSQALEHVLMPFLKRLRELMEEYKIAFTTEKYQDLFQTIISLFLSRSVAMEPLRPPNFTYSKAGCGDGKCRDCHDLNRFLQDPDRQTWDLTTTGQRRSHVDGRVSQSIRFRTTTIKNTTAPHTLRVTKTPHVVWESDHKAWLHRCDKARGLMAAVGYGALRQLLGDQYDQCVELRIVKRGTTALAERPSPSPRTKGRTQIIDLTEGLA